MKIKMMIQIRRKKSQHFWNYLEKVRQGKLIKILIIVKRVVICQAVIKAKKKIKAWINFKKNQKED